MDGANIGEEQIERASNLLRTYHHAIELKKEKCYPVHCEQDGKAGKELRLVKRDYEHAWLRTRSELCFSASVRVCVCARVRACVCVFKFEVVVF